ncbi:MAG: glycogen synthase GlgA [Ignavibacteriaceae bacterium]|nr:glycogen synthase GlgA [Ignavibacteriaceae bacterium]
MKIAFICSEAVPFAKTGGLADVAGSLPKALEKYGCEVKLFIPKYYSIDESRFGLHYNWEIGEIPIKINNHTRFAHVYQAILPGSTVEVNFIDCPHYFHRDQIYTDGFDEDERFILFCRGVIETLQRLKWAPDVIHCNDWQTGLIPLYLKENYAWDNLFKSTSTIFTIHNIGYQGRFSKNTINNAAISPRLFYPESPIEYHGDFSFMKTAIMYSDIINTVSNTYAKEILTPEFGCGMETVLQLRKKDLYGIINGVDYSEWDPVNDKFLPHHYSLDDLSGKTKNKQFLLTNFGLKFDDAVPAIGIVSRMVSQKGFDLFEEASEELMKLNAQWIILGSGEDRYEEMFRNLQQSYPDKVALYIGFNNELSHLVEAGTDMFLMPSLYEPCGLNQIYSLKYGTVPVVRKIGGLADTVHDWFECKQNSSETGTGFTFFNYNSGALLETVKKAIAAYADRTTWKTIQSNGMKENFSWKASAAKYLELYNDASKKKTIK